MHSAGPKYWRLLLDGYEPVLANAVGGNTRRLGCGVKANEVDTFERALIIGCQILDTSSKDSSSPLPL